MHVFHVILILSLIIIGMLYDSNSFLSSHLPVFSICKLMHKLQKTASAKLTDEVITVKSVIQDILYILYRLYKIQYSNNTVKATNSSNIVIHHKMMCM